MIEIKNLFKSFDTPVLKDVNIKFECGNIYVLKGISGSGKTTLLNIIAALDKDYDGKVLINNKDIKSASLEDVNKYRATIGYVMQQSLLFKNLKVIDNLQMFDKDIAKIEYYANLFNVTSTLNKYPRELSGGEKSRISLIRALLNEHKIIIFDEPTSSLDKKNSDIFVEYLKKIDIKDKIIIIATHKNIYDNIATCKIKIEYGKVYIAKYSSVHTTNKLELTSKSVAIYNKFIYSNRRSFGYVFNIILIVFMLAIMLVVSIKSNYEEEYLRKFLKDNAADVLDTKEYLATSVPDIISKTYYNYRITLDDYEVYPLLPKEDSIFRNEKFITYGNFPENESEVLVNAEYAKLKFNKVDVVGENVNVSGNNYKISGIIAYKPVYEMYNGIYFDLNKYPNSIPAIFLDYDIISNIGEKVGDDISVKIKDSALVDVYTTDKYETIFLMSTTLMNMKAEIDGLLYETKANTNMALLAIPFLSIVLILFLTNQISLELFYKRREMGYLQIFNYSKDQVKSIYLGEYLLNIFIDIIITLVLYIIAILFIYLIFGYNFFINPLIIIFIFLLLFIYSIIILVYPINKALKEDIITLIK